MVVNPFINLFRTKTEAFFFKNSIINTQFIFKGVQLLPNNSAKYIQVTNTPSGIDLEDWQVNVVNLKTEVKTDITPYFLVESLTNSLNGEPQLFWSLTDVPFDFGYTLVYLEITQAIGEVFYSTPFLLTDINSERTSQFHYKQSKEEVYQSIGLQCWFLDDDKKTELTTYYEVSTKNTVSRAIQTSLLSIYRTELLSKSLLINLTFLLESSIVYINYLRYALFEAVDLPEKVAQENFASIDFTMSASSGDSFFGLADYNGVDYGTADYNT
jgi:hypothetical protein